MLESSIVSMKQGCPNSGTLRECLFRRLEQSEEEAYSLAIEQEHCIALFLQQKGSLSNPSYAI